MVDHGLLNGSARRNRGGTQHERESGGDPSRGTADSNLFTWRPKETKQPRLRRAADVAVVESADLRQSNDSAVFGWLHGAWLGRVFLER